MVDRYGLSELYTPPNGGKVTAQYVQPKAKHGQADAFSQYHLCAWPLWSPSEDMGGEEETFKIPMAIE